MQELEELRLRKAVALVQARAEINPQVGVVLGSGFGPFAEALEPIDQIPYGDIPGMPQVGVRGHAGNLVLGRVGNTEIACLKGRAHLYEGHRVTRVVFGVRLLAELGCKAVLLTNAAGGIGTALAPGDLMLIRDHINLTGINPLVGPANPRFPRFPDLSYAYDLELRQLAQQAAHELGFPLREGVYAGMLGPSFETPAEIRMLAALGADAVGMSTVAEVIALRERGVRVGAVSCITNWASGIADALLSHEEVEATARRVQARFVSLLVRWIARIDAQRAKV